MDTTLFLAQLWGPAILAVGVGTFVSRNYYIRIYRDLEKAAFAVLVFGMAAMAAGIAQVSVHNTWGSLPEILVTLLGWGLFIKGTLFVAWPDFVDLMGDWAVYTKLIPLAGVAMLLIGGYLSWFAYFV